MSEFDLREYAMLVLLVFSGATTLYLAATGQVDAANMVTAVMFGFFSRMAYVETVKQAPVSLDYRSKKK